MPEPEGTVYVVRNRLDGKCYVGQTIRCWHERLIAHCRYGHLLTRAIRKHGAENFLVVRRVHAPISQLLEIERTMIREYNSLTPNGYNILEAGQIGDDMKYARSPETRARLSAANSGEKNPFYGRKHTPESIAQGNLSRAATAWKPTEEQREKLRRALTGRPVSQETREKLHRANKGKQPSELARQRSRETKLGTKQSPETIEKRRKALTGRPKPPGFAEGCSFRNKERITDEQKAQVYEVREWIKRGCTNQEIANHFGIHYEMARKIRNGTRYGWLV